MNLFKGFLLIWVIAELLIFFLIAHWVGVLLAVLLVILSMVVGGSIIRTHGMGEMRKAQEKMSLGQAPESEVLRGLALILGGIFLVIPGFLTSLLGLFLIIPRCREPLTSWLIRYGFIRPKPRVNPQAETAYSGRTIDGESERRP